MGQQVGLFERRVVVRPISIVKTISKLTKSFTMMKFLAMFCLFIALFNEMDAKPIEGKPKSTLQVDCGEVGWDRVVSEREDPSSDDDDNSEEVFDSKDREDEDGNVEDNDDGKDSGADDNSDAPPEDAPPADGKTEDEDEDVPTDGDEDGEEPADKERDEKEDKPNVGAEQVGEEAPPGDDDVKEPEDAIADVDEVAAEG